MEQTREIKVTAFQSTLPARGATSEALAAREEYKISIHAPRTGSDMADIARITGISISIHAPRTGSDASALAHTPPTTISIHAPRTGSDTIFAIRQSARKLFQSTLPARGATGKRLHLFYQRVISIHAPRTGSDK